MSGCVSRFGLPRPRLNPWAHFISPFLLCSYRHISDYNAVLGGVHFYWDDDQLGSMLGEAARLVARLDRVSWRRCERFLRYVFIVPGSESRYVPEMRSAVLGRSLITEPLVVAVVLVQMGLRGWHICVGGLDQDANSLRVSEQGLRQAGLRFACRCVDREAVTRGVDRIVSIS